MLLRPYRRVLLATLFVSVILVAYASRFIGVNTSSSAAPVGFYWRTAARPRRGQLVEVCLPAEVAKFGLARGYINRSFNCPEHAEAVGKLILGMPGDTIWVDPAVVLDHDSKGRPLSHVVLGLNQVKPGQIWLYGSARNSWDSKYYGSVPISDVRANLTPIWTW